MSAIVKKRKVDLECWACNPEWEEYFFSESLGQAQRLLCLQTVAVLKEYNMRRHWETRHQASSFASMSAAERKEAIVKLSGNLQKSTSLFCEQTTEADKVTCASC
ncbi:General transcription factor II-I repeat domain-containing protein 2 [Chionoecetes opilio]|uniref:General transcription factor II-I repeat domain-containing protein 2 n=1 Tax=Chionoecetes opilio TaxID=41210 RepID=A0A8J5CJX6_CHIOP|nr:General transcription factor II-I repeat domain-containing protein 2 [Chionoecetes opilio]